MGSGGAVLWWLTMAVMIAGAMCDIDPPPPQLLKVGEKEGWKPNVNYTSWAASKNFYVGYWIIFNFDKHLYSVYEVNETNYEKCDERNFITNITKGGRDVFNLTQARPYYFLSGGGYCWGGMKLTFNVTNYVAPAPVPAPAPAKNSGFMNTMKREILMFVVLKVGLVWALFSNMY